MERIDTADGLRSALHRGGWDIIISDYPCRDFSGLEALAVTLQLAHDVPFLLVSGTVGEEVAVESIKAGAADYLMKQNLIRFVPALRAPFATPRSGGRCSGRNPVLREQRSLLGMIYDNTSDALILHTWDHTGRHLECDQRQSADSAHGARPLESRSDESSLVGRCLEEAAFSLFDCDRSEARRHAGRFLSRRGIGAAKDSRSTAFRRERVDLICRPAPDSVFRAGRATRHVLAVVRDISARKQAEAARREFEARLAQSRKMEALGQLAGGVAHDFNNILAGILGFADVIGRTTSDPATAGFSGEIIQAATRARDLFGKSSCSAAGNPRKEDRYDWSTIAREAFSSCSRSAPAAVQVVVHFAEDVPYILGDATQLHQVVMNLSTNAVQAMGDEGGRLDVPSTRSKSPWISLVNHPPLHQGLCVRLHCGHGARHAATVSIACSSRSSQRRPPAWELDLAFP